MKELKTNGITFIDAVPGGDGSWYYGLSFDQGDLYEAEEIFKDGREVRGREFCLISFPEGEVFRPLEKRTGAYPAEAVYENGKIWFPEADFPAGLIRIFAFDCESHETETAAEIPLSAVKDCSCTSARFAYRARAALTDCSRSSGRKKPLFPLIRTRVSSCGTAKNSISTAGTKRGKATGTATGKRLS